MLTAISEWIEPYGDVLLLWGAALSMLSGLALTIYWLGQAGVWGDLFDGVFGWTPKDDD